MVFGGHWRRGGLAGDYRTAQLGLAAAYYLRLALVTAQRESESHTRFGEVTPQVGFVVGAALIMSVLATLILGVFPNEVLRSAESGAHTLQPPPVQQQSAAPVVINP